MYAVIELGGKQYRVRQGEYLTVDRVRQSEGETFTPTVLFAADDANLDPKNHYLASRRPSTFFLWPEDPRVTTGPSARRCAAADRRLLPGRSPGLRSEARRRSLRRKAGPRPRRALGD